VSVCSDHPQQIPSTVFRKIKRCDLRNGEQEDGEKVSQETKYSHHRKEHPLHNPNTQVSANAPKNWREE
jgi:hypothetical protein